MEKNVGGLDRIARLLLGSVFLVIALGTRRAGPIRGGNFVPLLFGIVGVELLATGVLQRCPGNAVLGVNTCEQSVPDASRTALESVKAGVWPR